MPDLTQTSSPQGNWAPAWLFSSVAMLAIVAATLGLIVGLLQVVSWVECVLLMLTGIVLSGGVLFTIATMQRLGKED